MDRPPSVHYQEIRIPLPGSPHLWTAANDEGRRRFQWHELADREKTPFCFIMRDVLDVDHRHHRRYHLTEADYHISLCALQSGIWEIGHEVDNCESDTLTTNLAVKDSVLLWSNHLDRWRSDTEKDCLIRKNYFSSTSAADSIFTPLSLTLWHISALMIRAPLGLLQGQACCLRCSSDAATVLPRNRARLRAWTTSPHARIAVWNAAQIYRVFVKENNSSCTANRLSLNPLAVPGLLKSAILICSYAYHTRACPGCTGSSPSDAFDLMDAEDDDLGLANWINLGQGIANWPPLTILICQCNFKTLAKWFHRIFEKDENAQAKFMLFLDQLSRS